MEKNHTDIKQEQAKNVSESSSKIANLSFEESLNELERITQKLESSSLSLENSILAYERGTLLKKRCSDLLLKAESKIEYLKEKDNSIVKVNLEQQINNSSQEPFEQSRLFQEKTS